MGKKFGNMSIDLNLLTADEKEFMIEYASNSEWLKLLQEEEIREKIPTNLVDLYPLARKKNRHFILHVGETNTGKTYNALKRFYKSERGVYLAPLRLLALEVQESAEENNVPCTYLTGEEECIREGATHISSTIEKLDIRQEYDVAVIDEGQLINDCFRGGAWTRAVLGVLADEVHICCSPDAETLIVKLIKSCGDTFEVERLKRRTPLEVDRKFKDIQPNDALIVFSRKKVLALESELRAEGINASIIYGSLPYSVRKNEMIKFLKGETNVVIATDAIGMGLNLPIERIIFMESEKFDGKNVRPLLLPEIKQIAGRAGRYGLFEKGIVTCKGNAAWLKESLSTEYEDIIHAVLPIPEGLINIKGNFVDNLMIWQNFEFPEYYTKADLTIPLELASILLSYAGSDDLDNRTIYSMITLPIDKTTMSLYKRLVRGLLNGQVEKVLMSVLSSNLDKKSLNALEDYHKALDVIYSFCSKFDYELYKQSILLAKEDNALAIMETLKIPYKKTCKHCDDDLAWDFPYDLCEDCFSHSKVK